MRTSDRLSRRAFLGGVGATAITACASRPRMTRPEARFDPLSAARRAAAYITTLEIETEHGLLWKKSADRADQLSVDLYHGSAGPTLFLLELYRATLDAAYLETAMRGARHLIATLPQNPNAGEVGLYGGIAGHGALLWELAETTGDAVVREAAARTVPLLRTGAVEYVGGGVSYGGYNDVLYGNAGIILWLLRAHAEIGDATALELAVRAGEGLIATAETVPTGRRWMMHLSDTTEMPNFSHGTSGVAFALARLYEETKDERFLAAALDGAKHVTALAYTEGDVCLVPHKVPLGEERYYLGLCHGPVGTSRLFHQLHRTTGDATWADWRRRSINGVLTSGVPEARTPGYWDNVGQCCGTASIAELMLDLHEETGDVAHLDLARSLVADIMARATESPNDGLEWIHAENRVEPYWKQSFTGYMQGAAGVGSLLVRLAEVEAGKSWKVRLPDQVPRNPSASAATDSAS